MSKRLTRRAELDGVKAVWYGYREVYLQGEVGYAEADKLAHYEDLEEQGRLIELPCAMGDTVYTIPRSKPRRWKVVYIGICGDGRHYMNIAWYKDHHNFETRSVYFDEIGKTVFLTQEDAEAELERIRNNG